MPGRQDRQVAPVGRNLTYSGSGWARRSLTCVEMPGRQDRQVAPVGRNLTYSGEVPCR